jgi:hypothetical protein
MATDEPDGLTPDEAFDLVASEARFDILQSLWEFSNGDEALAEPVSFSRLHDATDIRDSGQFNYHLDTLTPRFVRDAGDGYELTYAGAQVMAAAVSGVYTDADVQSVDPMPVGTCPDCGGPFEARYDEGHIRIECGDCDVTVSDLPAPPVIAATSAESALPAVFSRRLLADLHELNAGFCGHCGGRVDVTFDASFTDEMETDEPRMGVRYVCRACGMDIGAVVGAAVIDHPAVVGFLYDHGVDLRETYIWDLDWLFEAHATTVDEDPLRVELTVSHEAESLRLTLDEDLEVIETHRS